MQENTKALGKLDDLKSHSCLNLPLIPSFI
jgi:hypothetical protein